MATTPDRLPSTAQLQDHQAALADHITWLHQPAFDKAFADLTGTQPENDEWRRVVNWNFTGDDESYAQ
jgi:hypothetical protein